MHGLYIFSVWVHIVSAAIWIGGMVFIILVVIPILRRSEYREIYTEVLHKVGIRFRLLGWVSLLLLIVSGVFSLLYRGYGISDLQSGRIFQGEFGEILLHKLVLVISTLVISAVHDFWVGPKATGFSLRDPASKESLRFRRIASWLGRINFVIALLIVALGVMLVRGYP